MQNAVCPLLLLRMMENIHSMLKNIRKNEQTIILSVTFTP